MSKAYLIIDHTYVKDEYNLVEPKGIFIDRSEAEKVLLKLNKDKDDELENLYKDDYEYGEDEWAKEFRIMILEGTKYSIKEFIINQLNN